MSRWAETFAALSDGSDTLDTKRHSEVSRATKSQSVKSVMAAPTASETMPSAWGEVEEERAAIVERDGGIPRAWAEGFAQLHPDRPPDGVSIERWRTFVDDCGRFLDGGWAKRAALFGWGPLNLFGCDRTPPCTRKEHFGLLWLLNGDRLVELDHHMAVIATRAGTRQTFRRQPVAVGDVVLAWQLATRETGRGHHDTR